MFKYRHHTRSSRRFRLPRFYEGMAIAAFVLVGGGLLAYANRQTLFGRLHEPIHGPKLSSLSDEINNTANGNIDPNAAMAQVAPPVAAPPAPSAEPAVLGIAAGGGLTSMNQAALDQYFSELKTLGAKWVRWDVEWTVVQAGGPTSYDWSAHDRIAATAQKYDIRSLGIIAYTPEWARSGACKDSEFCQPADPAAFAAFAAQVATRYKQYNMHHWEIWNEPNYAKFWQPAANPGAYAALLKAAYASVKTADPAATVISGGLAPSATEDGSIAPVSFVQSMYASGAKGSFDAFGMHPYSYPVVASYQAAWNAWQQMASIRQIMSTNSDLKKLWITEFGAPTSGPGQARVTTQLEFTYPNDFMTEAAQAQIAEDARLIYAQYPSWFGGFFWYSLKDIGTSNDTAENFFGVLRFDGSKKPAYQNIERFLKAQ